MAAALMIVLVLALISRTRWPRDEVSVFEHLVSQITAPFQRIMRRVSAPFELISQEIRLLCQARNENLMMRDKVLGIPWLEADLQETLKENERLRELLKFAASLSMEYVPAEVIGRNPDNWFSTATINKGTADGVSRDDPVVTAAGLVGRVIKVTRDTATVMLMLDPDSGAGGLVQRTRDAGVVVGVGGPGQVLRMKLFSRESDVKVGDTIVTSGLGSFFPKGLPVGKVVMVGRGDYGLVKTADIQPFVNFDRLEEVLVLKVAREPLPRESTR